MTLSDMIGAKHDTTRSGLS